MTLAPKMDPAFEYHHVALDLDVYPVGFYLGIALECRFDAALDLAGVYPRTKSEPIVDAQHAGQFAHEPFHGFFSVLPVYLAFQGDPPMLHDDFDVAFGDGAYTFEAPERRKILEVNQQSGRQPRGVQNANFGPR